MTLGSNITYYRELNDITRRELAELLEVSTCLLQHYEKGRAEPSINRLTQMCEIFGITLDQLVSRQGDCKEDINTKYARLSKRDRAIVDAVMGI